MPRLLIAVASSLLLWGTASATQPLIEEIVHGPTAPTVPTDLSRLSCAELYRMRTELLRQSYDYVPAYLDDPRNVAALAIGTIATPAFYYLPYTGVQSYLRGRRAIAADAELTALREASAAKDCFVR